MRKETDQQRYYLPKAVSHCNLKIDSQSSSHVASPGSLKVNDQSSIVNDVSSTESSQVNDGSIENDSNELVVSERSSRLKIILTPR